MKTGRPPAYDTPEDMQQVIDSYFDTCAEEDRPPTVTGLALALGFEGRNSLLYYENDKPEFLRTIKRAKARIEQYLEECLYRGSSVTGLIFNLKNNFGWKDVQEVNSNINLPREINIIGIPANWSTGADSETGE